MLASLAIMMSPRSLARALDGNTHLQRTETRVIGFSLPLQWPDEPARRAEMERHVLQMIAMRLAAPPQVAKHLLGPAHDLFVASVAEHWPATAERPSAVAAFLARYGQAEG